MPKYRISGIFSRLSAKFGLALAATALPSLLIGLYLALQLSATVSQSRADLETVLTAEHELAEFRLSILEQHNHLEHLVDEANPALLGRLFGRAMAAGKIAEQSLSGLASTPEVLPPDVYMEMMQTIAQTEKIAGDIRNAKASGNDDRARQLHNGPLESYQQAITAQIGIINQRLDSVAGAARQRMNETSAAVRNTVPVALLVGLATILLGALFLRRHFIAPIVDLTRHVARIGSTGELAKHGGQDLLKRKDEFATLVRSFDTMIEELQHARAEMIRSAETSRALAEAEAELLRRKQSEAEAANLAKSQFLAMMSHEIRTPMNAVLGLTSILRDERLSHEQLRLVRHIHAAGDSLLEILNDILDYSRLESGSIEIERVAFRPHDLLDSVQELMKTRAAPKGLGLTIEIDPGLPCALLGDVSRLRQILINLVSNAIKFTEQGSVSIDCRTAAQDEDDLVVEWQVTDTGIGIAPEKIGKLFSRFVQADDSISRRYGGSGLGLAICRMIIEAMDGTIGMESEPGKGTTVTFRVPLSPAEAPEILELPAPPAVTSLCDYITKLGRPLRLLIVDDSKTNRMVAAGMLKDMNVLIETACDGREALAAIGLTDFDIVLMDVRMPEMDGLEATRLLRSYGNHVPIIGFTANAFVEDQEECLRAGMDGFVSKPIRKPELLAALGRILDDPAGTQDQPPAPAAAA